MSARDVDGVVDGGRVGGGVAAVAVRYGATGMHEVPEHDDWLTSTEAERLAGLRFAKRRQEARLGRFNAKRAVARVLRLEEDWATLRSLVIRNAADGAPEAFVGDEPAPVAISMTDRADWAVCVVAGGGDLAVGAGAAGAPSVGAALGCDLELVEPRSARFVADWFTPAERALVASRPDAHDLLANLVWSAKESALKVLRTGLRRDTRSVEVCFPDGLDVVLGEAGEQWWPLAVATVEGDRFDGWWCRFGSFVLTSVASAPSAPPESFVDPSPLTSAVPAHSWLPGV